MIASAEEINSFSRMVMYYNTETPFHQKINPEIVTLTIKIALHVPFSDCCHFRTKTEFCLICLWSVLDKAGKLIMFTVDMAVSNGLSRKNCKTFWSYSSVVFLFPKPVPLQLYAVDAILCLWGFQWPHLSSSSFGSEVLN